MAAPAPPACPKNTEVFASAADAPAPAADTPNSSGEKSEARAVSGEEASARTGIAQTEVSLTTGSPVAGANSPLPFADGSAARSGQDLAIGTGSGAGAECSASARASAAGALPASPLALAGPSSKVSSAGAAGSRLADSKGSCSQKLGPAMCCSDAPGSDGGEPAVPAAPRSVPAAGRVSAADVSVMGGGAGSSAGSGTLFGGGAAVEVPLLKSVGSTGSRGRMPPKGRTQESPAGASPPKIHCRTLSRALSVISTNCKPPPLPEGLDQTNSAVASTGWLPAPGSVNFRCSACPSLMRPTP